METSENCHLTRSIVWKAGNSGIATSIPMPKGFEGFNKARLPYVLSIYAPSKEFMKVTSYYLGDPNITKLIFIFNIINEQKIGSVSRIVNKIKKNTIHVSGFCNKHDKYVYELYAMGTPDELHNAVSQITKEFDDIRIETEKIPLE